MSVWVREITMLEKHSMPQKQKKVARVLTTSSSALPREMQRNRSVGTRRTEGERDGDQAIVFESAVRVVFGLIM